MKVELKNPVKLTRKVLSTKHRSSRHTLYSQFLVNKWIKDFYYNGISIRISNDMSIEADELNTRQIGYVEKLYIDKSDVLTVVCFIEKEELDKIQESYGKSKIEDYTLIPFGYGSVKNRIVQQDYVLYGFIVTTKNESAFYNNRKGLLKKDTSFMDVTENQTKGYLLAELAEMLQQ